MWLWKCAYLGLEDDKHFGIIHKDCSKWLDADEWQLLGGEDEPGVMDMLEGGDVLGLYTQEGYWLSEVWSLWIGELEL